jgi:Domain of unknown function (DUF4384)
MRQSIILSALLLSLVPVAGCPGGPRPAAPVSCGGQQRQALDCSSEVQYQGVKVQGGTTVLSFAAAHGSYEDVALRKITPDVAQYLAQQTRLCREYNACIIGAKEYHDETAKLGQRFAPIAQAAKQWASASYVQRKHLIANIYNTVATPAQKAESVTFRLTVQAGLPQSLGGKQFVLRPGEELPTGASVAFEFQVTKDAYVYLFQKEPSGTVNVLFPDPRSGVTNPLHAGVVTRIPNSGTYDLDAKDIGIEHVYVVATRAPLPNLEAALARVQAGKVAKIGDDQLLHQFTNIAPDSASSGCKARALDYNPGGCLRSRGLVLHAGPADSTGGASLVVQTDPGDNTIVKDFPFDHVMPEQYVAAQAPQNGPTTPGLKKRGIIMEEMMSLPER